MHCSFTFRITIVVLICALFTIATLAAKGPYGQPSGPITGSYWAEGPSAIMIGEFWYVYFDRYREGRYGAVRSKDLQQWEDISSLVSFPEGARHGTVFEVTQPVLERLLNVH